MRVTLPILSIFVAISTLFENGVVEASYRNINNNIFERRAVRAPPNKNPGTYKRAGTSGVSVMHLALTEPNKLVFIDKIEANPLKQRNGDPAISVEFDLNDFSKRVLDLQTDTFCSSGSFLGNGTLVHTGGTGKDPKTKFESGFQSIRFFTPCQNKKCQWFEDIDGLSTKRWYTSTTSLSDGRVIIIGGSTSPTGLNNKTINNPTFEFFPSTTKKSEPFPFLERTLPENLYPVVHLLSGPKDQTRLFVFANVKSIIWDWEKNEIIKELPDIPGPPRSYPSTAASVVLPLRPEKDYAMTVMICGGTKTIDPSSPAENSCGRINLVDLDTAAWKMEDFGGLGRVMPDAVILADGKIMFLNGAGKGTAGFNGKRTLRADNPVTVPVLYDPDAPAKKRFTTLADSGIPRLYHSVATSLPDGKVFITGSNPFSQVTTTGVKFQTEYRNQIYTPPYFFTKNKGATITSVAGNKKLNKGAILVKYDETVKVVVSISTKNVKFTSALAHFGFVTHSTHMSQRYVALTIKNPPKLLSSSNNKFNFELDVLMPPHGNIIPPGNHYLFINNHGVPSVTAVEINIQQ